MSDYTIHLIGGDDDETALLTTMPIGDLCQIIFRHRGRIMETKANDYFDAFCQIRLELEAEHLIPFCYGASLNVFPSGMSRDMSAGMMAYRLTLKQKPARTDLVEIFDEGTDVVPVFVAKQKEFFDEWCKSIRG